MFTSGFLVGLVFLFLQHLPTNHASTIQATGALANIGDSEDGSCRIQGLADTSVNAQYYTTISSSFAEAQDGCGRCVKLTCTNESACTQGVYTHTTYVLSISDSYSTQEIGLSPDVMEAFTGDKNTASLDVAYEFVTCPSSFLSGDIVGCLMESASSSYIPIQFWNSYRVIENATIEGLTGTFRSNGFMYQVNPSGLSSDWYESLSVTLTSTNGEVISTDLTFPNSSQTCANSTIQFSKPSGSEDDDDSSSSSSSLSWILPVVICLVVAAAIGIGAYFFIKRRRSRQGKSGQDLENPGENDQNDTDSRNPRSLFGGFFGGTSKSPCKKKLPTSNYRSERSYNQIQMPESTRDQELSSPATNYAQLSVTPSTDTNTCNRPSPPGESARGNVQSVGSVYPSQDTSEFRPSGDIALSRPSAQSSVNLDDLRSSRGNYNDVREGGSSSFNVDDERTSDLPVTSPVSTSAETRPSAYGEPNASNTHFVAASIPVAQANDEPLASNHSNAQDSQPSSSSYAGSLAPSNGDGDSYGSSFEQRASSLSTEEETKESSSPGDYEPVITSPVGSGAYRSTAPHQDYSEERFNQLDNSQANQGSGSNYEPSVTASSSSSSAQAPSYIQHPTYSNQSLNLLQYPYARKLPRHTNHV